MKNRRCDFKPIARLFNTFSDEEVPETLSSPVYANMEFSQLCGAPSVSFSRPRAHVRTANHLRLVCDWTPPHPATKSLHMNIKYEFRLCAFLTHCFSQVSCVICRHMCGYQWPLAGCVMSLCFVCECVSGSEIPILAVMVCVIASPLIFLSVVLTVRERMENNQEVNYLELTASHGIHALPRRMPAAAFYCLFLLWFLRLTVGQSDALRVWCAADW